MADNPIASYYEDRFRNDHFLSTFFVTNILVHWKIVIILLSIQGGADERIAAITNELDDHWLAARGFFYGFLAASFYTFGWIWFKNWVESTRARWETQHERRINDIKSRDNVTLEYFSAVLNPCLKSIDSAKANLPNLKTTKKTYEDLVGKDNWISQRQNIVNFMHELIEIISQFKDLETTMQSHCSKLGLEHSWKDLRNRATHWTIFEAEERRKKAKQKERELSYKL